MSYSFEQVAAELMLEPEELQEILQAYFEDAPVLLAKGRMATDRGDWTGLAKSMHSLKGACFNLRLDHLGEMAAQAEDGKGLPQAKLQELFQAMELAMQQMETEAQNYFATERKP